MQPEIANNSPLQRQIRAIPLRLTHRANWRQILVLLLALCAGTLAYQVRAVAILHVGWLGDQLFLPTSAGLGQADSAAGRWFGDELNETSPTLRSRWTRQQALVNLPDLGATTGATLVILAQGWPDAASTGAAPTIRLIANEQPIGSFTASPRWTAYRFGLNAAALNGGDLQIRLISDATLVSTADPRPKGLRVAQLQLVGDPPQGIVLPPLRPLLLLALAALAVYWLFGRVCRPNTSFLLAIGVVLGGAYALAFARMWAVVVLPWLTGLVLLAVLASYTRSVGSLATKLTDRFADTHALNLGLAITLVVGLVYLIWQAAVVLMHGMIGIAYGLVVCAICSLLAARMPLLVRAAQRSSGWLATRRGASVFLGGFLTLSLGYELYLIRILPGAGHADYADNAVVARNLVAGRGWVVDYVTQFYRLYPSLTRPQETWPLLQPIWIAPFFWAFGAVDWAAKMPNLLATGILGVLVYRFGARIWDRRVGVLAAILLLTSNLFVLLVINVTSDLIFVVLAFAVVCQIYAWRRGDGALAGLPFTVRGAMLFGFLTGLLFLQKPANGVFIAAGCGIWLLFQLSMRRQTLTDRRVAIRLLGPFVVWTLVASAVFAPYLVRNLALAHETNQIYGSVVYSTESRDAWVIEYAPKWAEIYKIYTPEAGLSETEGLPDRSWILRWGFDRTLAKIGHQIEAVRDYLGPVWVGLPNDLSAIMSGREDKRLFFTIGAWLSLLGVLVALRRRPALIGLLGLAFLPYTVFLVGYWHANEERYFVALMPWLALFAALAIWRCYDRLAQLAGGKLAPFALVFALVLAGSVVGPSIPTVQQKIAEWHYADSDRLAYAWLRTNTGPDEPVMTRVPWQLNWHSTRPALMIPATTDRIKLLQLARYYGVRYLMFDVGQRPDPATQQLIEQMVADPALGFAEIYRSPVLFDNDATIIYRFPATYGNVPELRP